MSDPNAPQETNNRGHEAENQPQPPQSGSSGAWRWIFAAVVALILVVFFTNQQGNQTAYDEDAPAVSWRSDYAAAMQQAKDDNKPVLLAFHASWCGPCNQMKKTTYHDADVMTQAENYITVMIDVDNQNDVAGEYQVSGIPAYIILSPEGEVQERFVGYHPPDSFAKKLKNATSPAS